MSPLYERSVHLPHDPGDVLAWHLRPGAFLRLAPPWTGIELETDAPVAEGSRLTFRVAAGPAAVRWTAEHRDVGPQGFRDVQVSGPFAEWDHQHLVLPEGAGTRLRDRIRFRLPGGSAGALGLPVLRSELARTFAWRHRRTAADLRLHEDLRTTEPRCVRVDGAGPLPDRLRLLLDGGTHRRIGSSGDQPAPNVTLAPEAEGIWTIERADGPTDRVHLPLLLDPTPACRTLALRRAARHLAEPPAERPVAWLSLDDAAAALLTLAFRPRETRELAVAATRPARTTQLTLAPLAWIGEPRRLPADVPVVAPQHLGGRHPDLSQLLRDALGR